MGGGVGRWDNFDCHEEEREREREFLGTFLVILLYEFNDELKFTMGERV